MIVWCCAPNSDFFLGGDSGLEGGPLNSDCRFIAHTLTYASIVFGWPVFMHLLHAYLGYIIDTYDVSISNIASDVCI